VAPAQRARPHQSPRPIPWRARVLSWSVQQAKHGQQKVNVTPRIRSGLVGRRPRLWKRHSIAPGLEQPLISQGANVTEEGAAMWAIYGSPLTPLAC
jgi:hypothetical protein